MIRGGPLVGSRASCLVILAAMGAGAMLLLAVALEVARRLGWLP